MANIILPQVNILDTVSDNTNLLVEQSGTINRYPISDLDIGGGDVTIDLDGNAISDGTNPINADTLGGYSADEYVKRDQLSDFTPTNSVELNYSIVGGTTEPTNPTQNMIWINTDTPIGRVFFGNSEPNETFVEGDVWIHTDYSSNVSFNSLKIGSYYMDMVYPLEAKQWVSNALQDVTVKTYQNSAWVDWIALTKKLIWEGATEYTLNTSGGVTRQNGDGYISFQGSGEGYRNMWINDVDLSYHTRLIVEGSFDNLGASSDALRVWSNSTSSPSKDNSTAKKDLSSTGATLDISSLNGLYKVGISWEYTPLQKITNFYLDN